MDDLSIGLIDRIKSISPNMDNRTDAKKGMADQIPFFKTSLPHNKTSFNEDREGIPGCISPGFKHPGPYGFS